MQLDLRTVSTPLKVLLSAFLLTISLGYLVAVLFLFLIDVEPHQRMGMDVLEGTIHKYYGRRGDTALQGVFKGSMGEYVTPLEKELVSEWVEGGASAGDYAKVQPIFEKNCVECHGPSSGLSVSPLTTYDEVKAFTAGDLGESIKSLARFSHDHLFGISFIFLLTGAIFSLSSVRQPLKILILVIPFVAMLMDIGSWWVTK